MLVGFGQAHCLVLPCFMSDCAIEVVGKFDRALAGIIHGSEAVDQEREAAAFFQTGIAIIDANS